MYFLQKACVLFFQQPEFNLFTDMNFVWLSALKKERPAKNTKQNKNNALTQLILFTSSRKHRQKRF